MTIFNLHWIELAIAVALFGSLWVSPIRKPIRAFGWGLAFSGAALLFALLAGVGFYFGIQPEMESWTVQPFLFGRVLFALDNLSGPMVVLVALLHFLTALATGRTKMRRFSLSWSLACAALRLGIFSCTDLGVLLLLLIAGVAQGFLELVNRGKPLRVYLLHMGLAVGFLLLGWAFVKPDGGYEGQAVWAMIPLLAGILILCGTVPAHCWVTDWFEHASFGNALLLVTPLTGVYAAVRLVLPIAPDWALQGIGLISIVTALYAAGMAIIQQEGRRFFAYLFLSHASLVLLGLELHTPISLTGAFALWVSITLSLGGFGLTLRALEARFGRLSLSRFHGLYEHSPALAVCFLLTGLASVGFPGTLGFVAAELLVEGAIEANPFVGLAVILTSALNGIAVVRVYFLLFTGTRHVSTVSLDIGPRERFAVLTLTALIFGGGVFPQPGIASRHQAATDVLDQREQARGGHGANEPPVALK